VAVSCLWTSSKGSLRLMVSQQCHFLSFAVQHCDVEIGSLGNVRYHQNEISRIAKQMVKERHDITGSNCLKGVLGKVIVDEKGIKYSWKEYMEKLMNEENEWDHRIRARVKEGPADCIRIDEVGAALKNMKRHKAPGLPGLAAEMVQTTGILELSGYWIYVMIF